MVILHNFIEGIKNLWTWFPIIWKDRNYDDAYIFYILEHKLKLQAKSMAEADFHTSAQRDAEIMLTCVRLMEKVRDEFYRMEYTNYYECKYSFEKSDEHSGKALLDFEIIEENFDEYFKKYPTSYKKVLREGGPFDINNVEGVDRKERIAMNIAIVNHDKARKVLFDLMSNNIESWWW